MLFFAALSAISAMVVAYRVGCVRKTGVCRLHCVPLVSDPPSQSKNNQSCFFLTCTREFTGRVVPNSYFCGNALKLRSQIISGDLCFLRESFSSDLLHMKFHTLSYFILSCLHIDFTMANSKSLTADSGKRTLISRQKGELMSGRGYRKAFSETVNTEVNENLEFMPFLWNMGTMLIIVVVIIIIILGKQRNNIKQVLLLQGPQNNTGGFNTAATSQGSPSRLGRGGAEGGGNSLYFVWYRPAAGIAHIFQLIYTSIDHDFISNIHL